MNSPDSFSLYTAIPLESASNSWNDLNVMLFGSFHHQLFVTIPVETQDTHSLPTLHSVLQSTFLSASSCLLTIGPYVLQYLERMDHTHTCILILIPLEKMDFHQVMVHPV